MLAQVAGVVGRELVAADDGAVAGEMDDDAGDLVLGRRVAHGQHAHVGVDGAGRADDLVVVRRAGLAGVRDLPAVAHQEAAVERDVRFGAEADADLGGVQRVPGLADGVGDRLGHLFGVDRILVAAEAAGHGAAAVRVVGADQHVVAGNLRRPDDQPPGRLDGRLRDEQGVDADERGRRVAVVDDAGRRQQLVADAGPLALEEAARHFHAHVGRDVADAETDLQHDGPPTVGRPLRGRRMVGARMVGRPLRGRHLRRRRLPFAHEPCGRPRSGRPTSARR